MFSKENLEVSHLKIFGCPMYIHIPKQKRTKIDPSGKKGLFVGYSEQSKSYRIYILGYRQIELSRYVTFDEEYFFRKLKKDREDEEEHETIKAAENPKSVRNEEESQIPEDHDMIEPQRPKDFPNEMISHKRRPAWAHEIIEEEERYGVPEGTIRESKKPKPYPSYVALMCNLVDKENTCFEEETKQKEWVDYMVEEYQSIINNDVWEIVP